MPPPYNNHIPPTYAGRHVREVSELQTRVRDNDVRARGPREGHVQLHRQGRNHSNEILCCEEAVAAEARVSSIFEFYKDF